LLSRQNNNNNNNIIENIAVVTKKQQQKQRTRLASHSNLDEQGGVSVVVFQQLHVHAEFVEQSQRSQLKLTRERS
jgi:hypothetical protein